MSCDRQQKGEVNAYVQLDEAPRKECLPRCVAGRHANAFIYDEGIRPTNLISDHGALNEDVRPHNTMIRKTGDVTGA